MKGLHHSLNITGYFLSMILFFIFILTVQPDVLVKTVLCFFFPYHLTGYFMDCYYRIEGE
jgi:hypothetical protein